MWPAPCRGSSSSGLRRARSSRSRRRRRRRPCLSASRHPGTRERSGLSRRGRRFRRPRAPRWPGLLRRRLRSLSTSGRRVDRSVRPEVGGRHSGPRRVVDDGDRQTEADGGESLATAGATGHRAVENQNRVVVTSRRRRNRRDRECACHDDEGRQQSRSPSSDQRISFALASGHFVMVARRARAEVRRVPAAVPPSYPPGGVVACLERGTRSQSAGLPLEAACV